MNCFRIRFSVLLFVALLPLLAQAQGGVWTWMRGSSTANAAGNFGTQGIPAPTNDPPAMYAPYSWTDAQGNGWLMGGINSTSFLIYDGLWKFDPLSLEWTWMKGSSTVSQVPDYGTIGVSAPTNNPGSRFRGCSWTDLSGNLWLFGGYGFDITGAQGQLNDLWKYDIATNEWTWMKGPQLVGQPGTYGTLNVPAPGNIPPARHEGNSCWTAPTGELWLFGGEGSSGYYSDMWRYDPASNNWTWMSGPNTTNAFPNYGTLQTQAASNTPGARASFNHWIDATGNFWLFGGVRFNNTYNDMWRYNPAVNQWTWMGGSSVTNDPGIYGLNCVAGGFRPSARMETRTCWTDMCQRLWMSAGTNNSQSNQLTHDTWVYDPLINEFLLANGSSTTNTAGNFGVQGVAAPTNLPPATAGGVSFQDAAGGFWFYGGLLNAAGGTSNALWRFQPDMSCSSVLFTMTAAPLTGCYPLPVSFSVTPVSSAFSYSWDFGDPTLASDTSNLPAPSYTYTTAGNFTVTVIITNTNCVTTADTITTTVLVTASPVPNLGPDTVLCGASVSLTLDAGYPGATFNWNTSPADTNQTLLITAPGTYGVQVNLSNCFGTDSIVVTSVQPPSLGADTAICTGQALTLSPGSGWDSYVWNDQSQGTSLQPTTSGTYWVEVTQTPCVFRDSIDIIIHPLPVVNLGPDTVLCPGAVYTLDAGNPGATYAWSTGAATQTITPTVSGTYSIAVSANGCPGGDTVQVDFLPELDLGPDQNLCNTPTVVLDAGPGLAYLWNTGDTTRLLLVAAAGAFSVQVDNGVCQFTDNLLVTGGTSSGMLYVPNSFTPNGNGNNDVFLPKGDGITAFDMRVFNRWGEQVFRSTSLSTGWDGTLNGVRCQEDTYVYLIEYYTECTGSKPLQQAGHVNMIR